MAWNAQPPGWRPGGGWLACAENDAHSKPEIARNQAVTRSRPVIRVGGLEDRLRYRRLVEALHRRGARPLGEVLLDALRRLPPTERAAVLAHADQICRWSPETIRALDAAEYPAPPIQVVR